LETKLINYQRKYEAQKRTELKTEVFILTVLLCVSVKIRN